MYLSFVEITPLQSNGLPDYFVLLDIAPLGSSQRLSLTRNLDFAASRAALVGHCRTMRIVIAKELLEVLVCPVCKMPLEYRQERESLKCTSCRRVYRVKDDIPIMLIDEATIE